MINKQQINRDPRRKNVHLEFRTTKKKKISDWKCQCRFGFVNWDYMSRMLFTVDCHLNCKNISINNACLFQSRERVLYMYLSKLGTRPHLDTVVRVIISFCFYLFFFFEEIAFAIICQRSPPIGSNYLCVVQVWPHKKFLVHRISHLKAMSFNWSRRYTMKVEKGWDT